MENGAEFVFNQIFIEGGRGFGKNGYVSALTTALISEVNGIKNYNVDIVATAEDQAKTSFEDIYAMIDDNEEIQPAFNYTKIKKIRKCLTQFYCDSFNVLSTSSA